MTVLPLIFWYIFIAFILIAVAMDLMIYSHFPQIKRVRLATMMTALWVSLSFVMCFLIWKFMGTQKALEYFTGYVVELSLSLDNVFVFLLIFSYFGIPSQHQHKLLFYGILGAIFMRLIMITVGISLIHHFQWLFYIFGAFLIYTGYKMMKMAAIKQEFNAQGLVNKIAKIIPIDHDVSKGHFFIRKNGVLYATPMFLALLMVEKADLIFALDSVPAILAITQDAFIVFTSNVFAIIGLRSLYFMLAHLVDKFHYLKYALSFILMFIGVKMLLLNLGLHIPTIISLSIIVLSITLGVLYSIRANIKKL